MKTRSRLVWRVSAVVVVILTVAIALSGYANNLISGHYSLESARAFLRFNSESIIKGIGQLMMSRNNEGIEQLIVEMSRDSRVFGDIQLVSHHTGEIVASRFGADGGTLVLGDRACALCHDQQNLNDGDVEIVDAIVEHPDGYRVLSVMAPILNEQGCRTAACHAHSTDPEILGFLNADYSLERVDAMASDRRILILITVFASLLLGVAAMWFMFTQLLERPISGLIAGTKRISNSHFEFRFDEKRDDEIGDLQQSFNLMTATIQADRDELRSAKEHLERMLESSADIIITVGDEGYIQTFNRGAEQALGYRRDEMIGQRAELLFADPGDSDGAIARLKHADSVRNFETNFRTKGGETRSVLLTLSLLRDADGNRIGTLGIGKDMTVEQQLQQELVRSQKFAAIGQAVTGIQHAIKNALNGLKGGAYLVRSGAAKDDRQRIEEGGTMVEEGIELISGLSRNMLDYAREWKLELHRVDLIELVAKINQQNLQAAADRGVALRHEAPGALPAVLCDAEMIRQAVTDIVINAIDACTWKDYGPGEDPEVVCRNLLTEKGDFFIIEVRDNGCGMSDEIRQSIFTPFFSTKKTRGAGLGLALTARIIEAHGGEVSVESKPDQGAAFRVHLPIDGPRDKREAVDGPAGSRS